ncbi:MAG: hypothetical protein FJ254_06305 [Phycisphaerae bacterium]|nr:hypothetical protein [Phycisphaerae bacterium]
MTAHHLPRPPRHKILALTFAAAMAIVAPSGCARWASSVLEDNHAAFNSSVADAMDRQMLLNIVRMSQCRSTQWMTVSLINVEASVGAGANGAVAVPSDGMVSGGAGGNLDYSFTPNITFVPQQGERLARELMSPIPVSTVERLVSAGWPAELVILMCVEKLGATQGFDVTGDRGIMVENGNFGKLLQGLSLLGSRRLVSLSQVPETVTWNSEPIPRADVTIDRIMDASSKGSAFFKRPDGDYDYRTIEHVPVITFYEGIEKVPEAAEVARMLNLPLHAGSFRLVASEDIWPGDTLSLRSRSFIATLQLFSMGVDPGPNSAPPPTSVDTEAELYERIAQAGPLQDLAPYVRAVFRVECSDTKPKDPLVAAHDGRHWYWIDRGDHTSRVLFAMVRDMYDLQVSSDGQTSPILTLPVGSGR